VTSKGVGGVTAGEFVTLAGTQSIIPDIPVAGFALVLGVDRFMDAMRTATNVVGNAVHFTGQRRRRARRHTLCQYPKLLVRAPPPAALQARHNLVQHLREQSRAPSQPLYRCP
jgi:hypothetical protein